jgi:signal peptidase I
MNNNWNRYKFIGTSFVGLCVLIIIISATGGALNIDHSIPKGLYWKVDEVPMKDQYVLCEVNKISSMAIERNYGNGLNTIGKRIIAETGDTVRVSSAGVEVNGKRVNKSSPIPFDSQGRKMPVIDSTFVIKEGFYFLLGSDPRSFDSRYFGAVKSSAIKSTIIPIITF